MKKIIRVVYIVAIIFIGFISFNLLSKEDKDTDEYIRGRILHLENVTSYKEAADDGIKEINEYRVVILEGEDKGEQRTIESPIYEEMAYNINLKENQDIVLFKDGENKDINIYYIVDIDKRKSLMTLIGVFALLTVFIAKMKGLKALFSLTIVVGVIYYIFLPSIVNGYSPIIVATICSFLCSAITIFLTTGFSKKGIVAILGSVGGVVVAGVVSMFFSYKMGLTGFESVESLNFSNLLKNIKMKEIISAGVIVGSMGAVMDVSMSISSALTEIEDINPSISKKEIFSSGMRIGSDIIGTMVNTLILAYIGSGILSTLFIYVQKEQFPAIRILNFESIAADILRAFAGSIGILISVPITAYIFGKIIKTKKEEK